MEQRHIDRIRNPQFPVARRGYDQREVDNFMIELAEWLESRAAEEVGSFAVKRKLEMVGRSTANILMTTEKEAEELRKSAEREVAELTERADNAIKFLSDMFSARLYKLAAAKVGVPDYKDLVTQKLQTAEDLYRFMVDQFNQSRAFVLELMVVIILVIELVFLFGGKV